MGILQCKWASNCFKCPNSWCREYCSGPRGNLHLSDADMIIATFPNKNYGYYKENDLESLAKKLGTTEADVLLHANTDGWIDDTLLIWVKDKPELITKVKAFWPDGRSMLFENTTKAGKYFNASVQTVSDKARGRNIFKDVLLVKADVVPTEDELFLLRRDVPSEGDIPAPTAQEQEVIARVSEAHRELRGRDKIITSILCTWKTGEKVRLDTLGFAESVLRIASYTIDKYSRSGEPYRGATFTKMTQEQEQAEELRRLTLPSQAATFTKLTQEQEQGYEA